MKVLIDRCKIIGNILIIMDYVADDFGAQPSGRTFGASEGV